MKQTILLFTCFLISIPSHAEQIYGKAVGVTDGDTLTLLTPEKRQVKVRLAEIDTPESKQPYGMRAKQALSDLAFLKEMTIVVKDKDRYGRMVSRVYVGSTDVNAALVEQGAAWVYRQYSHDPDLLDLEQKARVAKRGLWALPESEKIPPWEWRRAARTRTTNTGNITEVVSTDMPSAAAKKELSYQCGRKRTCKQMNDCTEARYYLNDCGVRSLDRDGDGVPCESICR